MRFLKVKINDETTYYIPLDISVFQFYERGESKYKVGILVSGKYISLIQNDKEFGIGSIDEFMKEIADASDRDIVDLRALLERHKA